MVDNQKSHSNHSLDWNRLLQEDSFEYKGVQFYANRKRDITYSFSGVDYLNLRHTITIEKHIIENSIHKAHSKLIDEKGNHNNFNYRNLVATIQHISKTYNLNLEKTYIDKFEYGINIDLNFAPSEYLYKVHRFNHLEFLKLLKGHKQYGIKAYMAKEQIKLYDKKLQVWLTDGYSIKNNTLRIEVILKKTRLHKEFAATWADLVNPDNYTRLLNHLTDRFSQIRFVNAYDLSKLTSRELTNYYAGLNFSYWEQLKQTNYNTYKTARQRYLILQRKLNDEYINDPLLTELRQKLYKEVYRQIEYPTCNIPEKSI